MDNNFELDNDWLNWAKNELNEPKTPSERMMDDLLSRLNQETEQKLSEFEKHLITSLKLQRKAILMEIIENTNENEEYDREYNKLLTLVLKLSRIIDYMMTEQLRNGGA